jgi:hypothetical protein
MIDDGDCGAIGGMKIGKKNRSTRSSPAPAPLYPPQIPHDQNRARTRAAAVGSRLLTIPGNFYESRSSQLCELERCLALDDTSC